MIKVRNLSKAYDNTKILKGIDLELGEKGLVMIVGESGCGKSTLIHCLSLLLDCEGDIIYDSVNLRQEREEERGNYRLEHIGLIFQDFKLFENETAFQNVLLPRQCVDNKSKERNDQDAEDALTLCGMKNLANQIVNKLSGGEKQRVAIARALVNHPKYVFADEPTGSLDKENSTKIMDLLKSIAKDRLVVVVSHDITLIDEYADRVLYLADGVITEDVKYEEKESKRLLLPKRSELNGKCLLPFRFIFSHIRKINKSKRWRSNISKVVISLGLIGIGLSFVLSDALSEIVMSNYSQLISENQVIIDSGEYYTDVTRKESLLYQEVEDIEESYDQYVYDVGVAYLNDMSTFFEDDNHFCIEDSNKKQYQLPGLDASSINSFIWLDMYPPESDRVFPEMPVVLDDDEVVLGLTMPTINSICSLLEIGQGTTALSNYISSHTMYLYFYVSNDDWTYADQQIFTVRAFTVESSSNCFYHYNHRWNEKIFEEDMYMPSSESLGADHDMPWYLDKIYYLECGDYVDEMLDASCEEDNLQIVMFDTAREDYFPNYRQRPELYSGRLMCFLNMYNTYLSPYDMEYVKDYDPNIKSLIYGSNRGYAIYGSSYMSGFAADMYFSFNDRKLDEVVDVFSYYLYDGDIEFDLDEVLRGYYTVNSEVGVVFSPLDGEELSVGRLPENADEVVVSSGLIESLGYKGSEIPKHDLLMAYAAQSQYLSNNYVQKDFVTSDVTIVGIIDEDTNVLYQDSNWMRTYFMTRFNVTGFDLLNYAVSVNIYDSAYIDRTISILKSYLPSYNVYSPLKDVNDSVTEITDWIEFAILIFSVVAIAASALLIFSMINLLVVENRREFGLLCCLGVSKKQSFKMILGYGLYLCLISFIISIVELVFVMALMSIMYSTVTFTTSFISAILTMFVVSLLLGLFACLLKYRSMTRLDPLEAIKK